MTCACQKSAAPDYMPPPNLLSNGNATSDAIQTNVSHTLDLHFSLQEVDRRIISAPLPASRRVAKRNPAFSPRAEKDNAFPIRHGSPSQSQAPSLEKLSAG
jgi:hypothetical protein